MAALALRNHVLPCYELGQLDGRQARNVLSAEDLRDVCGGGLHELTELRRRGRGMTERLYTPAQAADVLNVRESWLRKKAAARAIPCTFVGKHLRFSGSDLDEIIRAGARKPTALRRGRPRRRL